MVLPIYWFPFQLDLLIVQASYLNLVDPTSRNVVKVKCTFSNSRWGLCWSRSVMSRNNFPWTVNNLYITGFKSYHPRCAHVERQSNIPPTFYRQARTIRHWEKRYDHYQQHSKRSFMKLNSKCKYERKEKEELGSMKSLNRACSVDSVWTNCLWTCEI